MNYCNSLFLSRTQESYTSPSIYLQRIFTTSYHKQSCSSTLSMNSGASASWRTHFINACKMRAMPDPWPKFIVDIDLPASQIGPRRCSLPCVISGLNHRVRACHTARGCVPLGDVSIPILSVGCRERPLRSRKQRGGIRQQNRGGRGWHEAAGDKGGDTRQQEIERGHTSAKKRWEGVTRGSRRQGRERTTNGGEEGW